MGGLLNFLGGPVKALLDGASKIIDQFVADPSEKLKAQQALLQMQLDFQTKMAEADTAFAAEQAKVLVAEAQSESWLTRNWRPLIMCLFGIIIANNYIIAPIFGLASLPIPDDMWSLMKIGLGGYVVGRSVENVASWAPDIIAAKTKR